MDGLDGEDRTHDPGWKVPYELGAWPDENEGPEPWIKYALRLLANEIDCIIRHVDRGDRGEDYSDYFDTAMHMGNVAEGVHETAQSIFQELLNDEERIAVTMHLMEKKLGIPMRVEEGTGPGGGRLMMIVPDKVDIPDSLEGL